jgi:hypothetical protein
MIATVLAFLLAVRCVTADDADRRDRTLERMRSLAHHTAVRLIEDDGTLRPLELRAQPVFRYNDEVRGIHDSTLWVWSDGGRPAALQKIEDSHHRVTGEARWTYCFTSLADRRLRVQWDGRQFESRAPGLVFAPLPGAVQPAETTAAQGRQLRQLARRFAATLVLDPARDSTLEMRLLPRPVLEYSDEAAGVPAAGLFGFATYGTNPDALLVLEIRPGDDGAPQWSFAAARLTTGGVHLRYDDREVWLADFVPPQPEPFDTWTFFFVPRAEE